MLRVVSGMPSQAKPSHTRARARLRRTAHPAVVRAAQVLFLAGAHQGSPTAPTPPSTHPTVSSPPPARSSSYDPRSAAPQAVTLAHRAGCRPTKVLKWAISMKLIAPRDELPAAYLPDFKKAVHYFCIHAGGRGAVSRTVRRTRAAHGSRAHLRSARSVGECRSASAVLIRCTRVASREARLVSMGVRVRLLDAEGTVRGCVQPHRHTCVRACVRSCVRTQTHVCAFARAAACVRAQR